MYFERLWPLGFLTIIPFLILLYMLKKQNKKKVVSSIFLWQEICETTYADKPWQKLRKHILLILQIISILFLILALMAPHMPWGGVYYKNVIFVVDHSASMNAKYEEDTRLEAAIKWIEHYIEKSKQEFKGSVITAGDKPNLILSRSDNRQSLLSAIQDIKPTYEGTSNEEAIQLAKSLGESIEEDYEIIVLTDKKLEDLDEHIRCVYFGLGKPNGAITLMSHQKLETGMMVLMQVANKGNAAFSSDVCLYGEDKLLDVQEVTLSAGETATLRFKLEDSESLDYNYLKGELALKDALPEDNVYYYVQNQSKGRKVLLVTESNIFLEKALMSLQACELYKTTDINLLESDEVYDLYVIDTQEIDKLPSKGNVLLIGCDLEKEIERIPFSGDCKVEAEETNLPAYLKNINFVASDVKGYKLPYWAKSLLQADGKSVAFIGERNGQKISGLGFDLWSSDFALKSDFPLLMYYLVDELLDTSRIDKVNVTSGEKVLVRQKGMEEKIKVTTLSGMEIPMEEDGFNTSSYLGIYEVEIQQAEKTKELNETNRIAVNYPSNLESDLSVEIVGEEQSGQETGSSRGDKDVSAYMILALLGVILAEWYFYRKGY